MNPNNINLRNAALTMFSRVFKTIDAEIAVQNAVKLNNTSLEIFGDVYALNDFEELNVVAFGKAAITMSIGLEKVLGNKINRGLISAPKKSSSLKGNWKIFIGGHPIPNRSSLLAAKSTIELLKKANHPKSLVIFLISGGGSAMLELPKDENISLKDLRKTNQILVNCGAAIEEINKFRRAISKVKGGGLIRICPLATKVSLIISDTNRGDLKSVASGPTIVDPDSKKLIEDSLFTADKYNFRKQLPDSIIRFLEENRSERKVTIFNNSIYTLLENRTAVNKIAELAQMFGFVTETADELIENPIKEGCQKLIQRLLKLRNENKGNVVALISGGEFVCPVRGAGIGGRNLETVLRSLLEIESKLEKKLEYAILSGGTDGIDGNSLVTGAIADNTSLKRAKKLGLNAEKYLANSDSYNFFSDLGDVIITGQTGTNVRDVRILLAR